MIWKQGTAHSEAVPALDTTVCYSLVLKIKGTLLLYGSTFDQTTTQMKIDRSTKICWHNILKRTEISLDQ